MTCPNTQSQLVPKSRLLLLKNNWVSVHCKFKKGTYTWKDKWKTKVASTHQCLISSPGVYKMPWLLGTERFPHWILLNVSDVGVTMSPSCQCSPKKWAGREERKGKEHGNEKEAVGGILELEKKTSDRKEEERQEHLPGLGHHTASRNPVPTFEALRVWCFPDLVPWFVLSSAVFSHPFQPQYGIVGMRILVCSRLASKVRWFPRAQKGPFTCWLLGAFSESPVAAANSGGHTEEDAQQCVLTGPETPGYQQQENNLWQSFVFLYSIHFHA